MSARARFFALTSLVTSAAAVWSLFTWNGQQPAAVFHLGAVPTVALLLLTTNLFATLEFRGTLLVTDFTSAGLAVCLACSSRPSMLVGLGIGVLASGIRARTALIKTAFNVANCVLGLCCAITTFDLIAGGTPANTSRGWIATIAACIVCAALTGATVALTISIMNGARPSLGMILNANVLMTAGNTILGLLALQVLWVDWRGSWMIAVAALGLWLGYRSYLKLRQRYGTLDLLHTFSHGVAGVTETDDVTITALSMAKELLRGEIAELVFRLPDAVVLKRIDDDGVLRTEAFRHQQLPPQNELFGFAAATVVGQGDHDPALRALADHLGWNDLAFAPLGVEGFDAVLVVANRLADVSTFDVEDLRVLETFAQNTGVALKVGELVDELRREVAEKEFQAMHDSLTGLPNRDRMNEVLAEIIPGASEHGLVAVLLMDLDDFKEVNDTLGHTTGDALLEEIGRRLTAAVGSRGTVARLGGDEFAVALCCMPSPADALEYVENLRALVEDAYVVDRLTLAVRFSIGVALSPNHGLDPRTLLQRADIAMYAAKKTRSGVKLYAEDLDKSSTRRLSLAGELAPALANSEFQLFYQPQLDLHTGKVAAVEALARWPHAVHRSVPPDEFIPLVEQSGLIGAFTAWALDTALRDVALWREEFPELRVSVNMSARNLLEPGFAGMVRQHLDAHGVTGDVLTLELTESTVMSDPEHSLGMLTELHQMGIRIAIDDFGTGYSSLSYLKRLPVAEVKIDKSFVMHMLSSTEDTAIVRSTIDLARSLGMETVAEGVESLEIMQRLATMDCWAAQGYHLARPLPSADIAQRIRDLDAEYGNTRITTLSSDPSDDRIVHFSLKAS